MAIVVSGSSIDDADDRTVEHRERLARLPESYDPCVRERIEKALTQDPGEYELLLHERSALTAAVEMRTADYDAVIFVTTPIQAPLLSEV